MTNPYFAGLGTGSGTSTDRINGVLTSLAIKAPCVAVTTAAITLSGLQTVNGVALSENDRVLVKNQASAVSNGIYNASTTAWVRAADCDGNRDLTHGTLVIVSSSVSDSALYELTTANPVTIGTSNLTFQEVYDRAVTYARTAAEIAASVTPTNYSYEPGNILRYGADPTGSADSLAAFQAAVNVASHGGNKCHRQPDGYYKLTNTLLLYYHATNNPNFRNPSGSDDNSGGSPSKATGTVQGFYFIGSGEGNVRSCVEGEKVGTVLNFTNATGNCVELNAPSASSNQRTVHFSGFAVRGMTTGTVIYAYRLPQKSEVSRVNIYNDADGTALDISGSWDCDFDRIYAVGYGHFNQRVGTGTGLKLSTPAGGGFYRIRSCFFSDFAYNGDFGRAKDASNTLMASHVDLYNCQFGQAKQIYGLRIRYGIGSLIARDCWFEGQRVNATDYDLLISDCAGYIGDPTGAAPNRLTGLIRFERCTFNGSTDGVSGNVRSTYLGLPGGTAEQKSVGNVVFEDCEWTALQSSTYAITRTNGLYNGTLNIIRPLVTNYGPAGFLEVDDAPQYGAIRLDDVSALKCNHDLQVVLNGTSTQAWKYLGNEAIQRMASLGSTTMTLDCSAIAEVPRYIRTTVSNGQTITINLPVLALLPLNQPRHVQQIFTVFKEVNSTGTITFDAGAGGTINGAATLSKTTAGPIKWDVYQATAGVWYLV